jgi:hypothetical protein
MQVILSGAILRVKGNDATVNITVGTGDPFPGNSARGSL